MSDLFADLDLESASDNPFKVDAGTYTAYVTDAKIGDRNKKDKMQFVVEFTIHEDGPMDGRKLQDYKTIAERQKSPDGTPMPWTPEQEKERSFLKMRLASLGVPDSKMIETLRNPQNLIGQHVVIVVVENDGYTNVRTVKLFEDSSGMTADSSNPFDKVASKKKEIPF